MAIKPGAKNFINSDDLGASETLSEDLDKLDAIEANLEEKNNISNKIDAQIEETNNNSRDKGDLDL